MKKDKYVDALRYTLVFLIISVGSGCGGSGDDLTRSMARDLILESENIEGSELTGKVQVAAATFNRSGEPNPSAIAILQQLIDRFESSGFGTGTIFTEKFSGYTRWVTDIELTDRAITYLRDENETPTGTGFTAHNRLFVTHQVDFGEVTGIAYLDEQKTLAQVEYTIVYSPTPIFELDPNLKGRASPASRKIHFRLYDDGWRKANPF